MSLSNLAPRYVAVDLRLLGWLKDFSLGKQKVMKRKDVRKIVALLNTIFDVHCFFLNLPCEHARVREVKKKKNCETFL